MALEIERRFLVNQDRFPEIHRDSTLRIVQGYISKPSDSLVLRARSTQRGFGQVEYNLTIKRKVQEGINKEFEIQMFSGFSELMEECEDKIIEKIRYEYHFEGLKFEVDFFTGKLTGMVVAEVELPSIDHTFKKPFFIEKDITGVKGLSNFDMAFDPEKAMKIYRDL